MHSACLLKILAKMLWNVPHHICSGSISDKRVDTVAHLFCRLIGKCNRKSIEYGGILQFLIIYAIRYVMTRVLPEPAPARIKTGPSI